MLAVEVAALDCLAFVPTLFAFAKRNHEFDELSFGQKFGRDDCHAGFFLEREVSDLFVAREKFTRFSIYGASACFAAFIELQTKAGVIEPELVVSDRDIASLELNMPIAGGTHLRACKYEPRYDFLAKLIIKLRSSIDDRSIRWFPGFSRAACNSPLTFHTFSIPDTRP